VSATSDRVIPFATHGVFNQVPPLEGRDLLADDAALREGVQREGGAGHAEWLAPLGRSWGGEPMRWGVLANEHTPVLHTHDRFGNRRDEVEFHPSWHALMRKGIGDGLHSRPWTVREVPGSHVARGAAYIMAGQAEGGFLCPTTMTFAAVPALRADPAIADEWVPRLTSTTYDPGLRDPATKRGCLAGMAMTEKQGGSDVRANTTSAAPTAEPGWYELTGHKWFCSAPMCDVFLVLAQLDEGLSCFVMPRVLPDGSRNAFHLQRLKDKLGNRSNASSEVEFHGAWAQLLGEPGRGVPTIIEMVAHTRLDCLLGSAAGMRTGVAAATWHAAHRSAFGKRLAEQPLMQNVLADLALESEAATALALRVARAYDERDEHLRRLATAIGKYYVCKRAPQHAFECLEAHGGNGYVEASGMPRLFRESPLMSIWEGSGNVMALDGLRALAKQPETLHAFFAELEAASGADPRLDRAVDALHAEFTDREGFEVRARHVVEKMARALQGSILVRHAPPAVADAFCAGRLAGEHGTEYGTLPRGTDFAAIVERATPPA
jgi:putative acyl-CoA dehydrogenase